MQFGGEKTSRFANEKLAGKKENAAATTNYINIMRKGTIYSYLITYQIIIWFRVSVCVGKLLVARLAVKLTHSYFPFVLSICFSQLCVQSPYRFVCASFYSIPTQSRHRVEQISISILDILLLSSRNTTIGCAMHVLHICSYAIKVDSIWCSHIVQYLPSESVCEVFQTKRGMRAILWFCSLFSWILLLSSGVQCVGWFSLYFGAQFRLW